MNDFRLFTTCEGGRLAVRLEDVFSVVGFSDERCVVKLRNGDEIDVKGSVSAIVGSRRGPDDPLAWCFLSGRAKKAIEAAGCGEGTPAQVAEVGKSYFAELGGVGFETLKELTDWLVDFGTGWK